MRIGVISDTHIEEPEEDLPARVYEIFSGVDLILHAGDIYVPQVLDRLERIAPVTAVEGNGGWDRRVKDQRALGRGPRPHPGGTANRLAPWDRLPWRHQITWNRAPVLDDTCSGCNSFMVRKKRPAAAAVRGSR